jgi:hypothetical protein
VLVRGRLACTEGLCDPDDLSRLVEEAERSKGQRRRHPCVIRPSRVGRAKANQTGGTINEANQDGINPRVIASGQSSPMGVAVGP